MREKTIENRYLLRRMCTYVIGLFLGGTATTLAVGADIGNSGSAAIGVIYSQFSGWDLGNCLIVFNSCLVLGQWILLGRQFKWKRLLQIPCVVIYSKSVDFTMAYMPQITLSHYYQHVLLLLFAMALLAFAMLVYVGAGVITLPLESFTQVLASHLGKPFHHTKIMVDCGLLLVAVVSGFVLFGSLVAIREGTLLQAIGVGVFVGLWKRILPNWIIDWREISL